MKKAKVMVHPSYKIGEIDRRLFGAFFCLPAFQARTTAAARPMAHATKLYSTRLAAARMRNSGRERSVSVPICSRSRNRYAATPNSATMVPNSAARSLLRGMQTRSSRYSQINAVR